VKEGIERDPHSQGDVLTHEEVGILLSTIDLRDISVMDPSIIIPMDKAFILFEEDIIDKQTIDLVMKKGFTRMPVCYGSRNNSSSGTLNFRGLLGVKRILGIDINKNFTLSNLLKRYNIQLSQITYVAKNTNLLTMFRVFQKSCSSLVMVVDQTKEGFAEKADKKALDLKRQESASNRMIQGLKEKHVKAHD